MGGSQVNPILGMDHPIRQRLELGLALVPRAQTADRKTMTRVLPRAAVMFLMKSPEALPLVVVLALELVQEALEALPVVQALALEVVQDQMEIPEQLARLLEVGRLDPDSDLDSVVKRKTGRKGLSPENRILAHLNWG